MDDASPHAGWIDALADAALAEGDVTAVELDGREIALYRIEGAVYATDNGCTHGRARLCEGFLLDHEIECPLHQGRFDVRDGRPTCEPAVQPLRCWPVHVADGRIRVRMAGG